MASNMLQRRRRPIARSRIAALLAVLAWMIAASEPASADDRAPPCPTGGVLCVLERGGAPAPAAVNPPCEPEVDHRQQARNVDAWSALRVLPPDERAPSAAAAQAEIDRIGGINTLLAIDTSDLREALLDGVREEVRAALREARIYWSSRPMVRDGTVEVRIRDVADIDRAASAVVSAVAAPGEAGTDRAIDVTNLGNGVLRFTLTEAELADRIRASRAIGLSFVQRRMREFGIANASVEAEGLDRIRILHPGIARRPPAARLIERVSHLDFRFMDASMSPCEALQSAPPAGSDVLFRRDREANPVKSPYLLKRRAPADGRGLAEVVAALDRETGEPIVAFRIDGLSTGRFVRAIRAHVGEPLAIVLDNWDIIAVPIIAEPLERSVRISGGLTVESAKELALVMRSGMGLWFKMIVVEEKVIAPKAAQ